MAFGSQTQSQTQYGLPAGSDRDLVQVVSSSSGLTLWLHSDRPGLHPSYLPGDVVQGKLRFTGSKRIKAAAVRAKFTAEATVRFQAYVRRYRHSFNNNSSSTSTSDLEYFSNKIALIPPLTITLQGSGKGMGAQGPATHLEPGIAYEWSFAFALPPGPLPGAFYYSSETRVRYHLCCYVDVPNWPDPEVKIDLDVRATPLPITPAAAQPVDLQSPLAVYGCCSFFSKGTALLTLGLPRGATVPFIDGARLDDGQLFPIIVGIDNTRSRRALGRVTLKLKGQLYMEGKCEDPFYYETKNQTQSFTVAEAEVAPGVAAGETLPPRALAFGGLKARMLPDFSSAQGGSLLQCPSFDVGGVLSVSYCLSLVVANGMGSDLKVKIPLVFAPTYPERMAAPPAAPVAVAAPPSMAPYVAATAPPAEVPMAYGVEVPPEAYAIAPSAK